MMATRTWRRHIASAASVSIVALVATMSASALAKEVVPSASDTTQSDAGDEQSGGIADIVVTAERRSESIQKTPIAISALDGDTLLSNGTSDLEGLSQSIPNLNFARNAGDAKIFIRGVGYNSISPGGETRVALYLDGIYQSRTQAGLLGFYDVERLEVLRGPQGTLYGRNSIAGTINILTREPGSSLNGYALGTVGNYGLIAAEGAVGGPLGPSIEARLAFRTVDRGGYGNNIATGEDANDEHSRSVRGKIRFYPSPDVSVSLIADYTIQDDHSGGYYYIRPANPAVTPRGLLLGGRVPEDKQDFSGFGPKNDTETYGASAQLDWTLGDATDLTVLGGYRRLEAALQSNVDGTTAELSRQFITEKSDTFSAELRLTQRFGDLADLILGAYYFHEKNSALNEVPARGIVIGLDPTQYYEFFGTFGRLKTDAFALFAQAGINLAPGLRLDLGARYSDEKKRVFEQFQLDPVRLFVQGDALNPLRQAQQQKSQNSFDPKVTVGYQITDRIYGYGTYSRGFKSGGYNIGGIQPPFAAEKLTNYEAGLKADLFDRRLRVNLSAFNYDYKQLQVSIVVGNTLVTRNAAAARVRGVEAEITAVPVDNLTFTLNAAHLDARYKDFVGINPVFPADGPVDLAGNRLANAPEYQIDAGLEYRIETAIGDFRPRVNVTWTDKIFFNEFNRPEFTQPSRTLVDLFLNWDLPGGGWMATAYVRNLTDKVYVLDGTGSAPTWGSPIIGQYGAPRTFGLTVKKEF